MSKKTEYAAHAEGCRRMADEAGGDLRLALRDAEAGWMRLARGCYDSPFGPSSQRVFTLPSARLPQ